MARRRYDNSNEDVTPQQRDLQQLLGLAQLHQLMTQPELESQHLEQTDQANRMTAAIHLLGLQQEAEQKQSALEEQQKLREASVKGNVMDSLISHLSQRTDVPLSTLADTLEKGGHGELATTLRTAHVQGVKDKTAIHLNNIKALGGDTKKVDTYLTGIGNDPEVAAAVKANLPVSETPTQEPESFARTLKTLTSTPTSPPGYDPSIGPELLKGTIDIPRLLGNTGAAVANYSVIPLHNLLASVFGAPALPAAKYTPFGTDPLMKLYLKSQPATQ